MKDLAVDVKDLRFSYGNTLVLQDVNIEVSRGDFIGVFGPNGGGKTTLLKLLMGFLQPDCGKVRIFGREPKEQLLRIGYVPQVMHLDRQFPISVFEVVSMGLLGVRGLHREKIETALDRVGLLAYKDRAFGSLSGGQAQRVLIARAIVSDPELLLLDEPTAHADPCAEGGIYELLFSFKESMTILMVTHHLSGRMDRFSQLLCVHQMVSVVCPDQVCQHVALGLYHPLATSRKCGL